MTTQLKTVCASTNGKIVLAAGVTPKDLRANALAWVSKAKEVNAALTDVTVGLFVHWLSQEHVNEKHGKGDTSLITDFMHEVYSVNPAAYKAIAAASRKILGLSIVTESTNDDGTQFKTYAELTKANRSTVLSDAPALLVELYNQGIMSKEAGFHKVKARAPGQGVKSIDTQASAAESKTYADTLIQDSGLETVISSAAGDESKRERLSQLAAVFAEMMDAALANPNAKQVDDMLNAACNKLKGALNVKAAAIAKKAS